MFRILLNCTEICLLIFRNEDGKSILITIAVSGTIGFIGLMVPHFTRLLVGGDHKKVLPISALLGGILVVWVDVAARMLIAPEELPVGILTAVIGGPIFIWMLKKNNREK